MSKPKMPQDAWGNPIPALGLRADGGAHSIAATSSTNRNATAFSSATKVISIYATVAVYIKFGAGNVTATNADHYFPAGIYYDFAINQDDDTQYTNLAVLRADTSDGTVYLSEKA